MAQKSYTRNGDDGSSCLADGVKRPKSDAIFWAVGAIDELASVIGIAKVKLGRDEELEKIQKNLFLANSVLSGYYGAEKAGEFGEKTGELERWIDKMDEKLPKLHKFIIYGGCPASAYLHFARAVARRAERSVRAIDEKDFGKILVYLNRLSSYFFARARWENLKAGVKEEEWKGE